MTRLLIFITLLTGACATPPIWLPGDDPVTVWADSDQTWDLAREGCRRWAVVGLTCKRSRYHGSADAIWEGGTDTHGHHALSVGVAPLLGGGYTTTLNYDSGGVTPRLAAHEWGHLLGYWEHLPEAGALMHETTTAEGPTDLDLDAIAAVWGQAPWEDAQ